MLFWTKIQNIIHSLNNLFLNNSIKDKKNSKINCQLNQWLRTFQKNKISNNLIKIKKKRKKLKIWKINWYILEKKIGILY